MTIPGMTIPGVKMPGKKISVIVCTRNRAQAITGCLDSLAAAIVAASVTGEAEIVVIDNASTDDTSARVSDWAKTAPVPVNLQVETRPGLCFARNCGLRAAKGEMIAFTDDDCRWDASYVSAWLARAASDTGAILRCGRVELGDPTDLPLSIQTSREARRWSRAMRSARSENFLSWMIGCNMTMNRQTVQAVGDFDERFTSRGLFAAEEMDYICRAYLAGAAIEYAPDMWLKHFHGRKQLDHGQRLMRNYMIGTGALFTKFIFKDADLCRQAYWDFKKAVKEVFTGKNYFRPEIGFSYRMMMVYMAIGAYRFLTYSWRKSV